MFPAFLRLRGRRVVVVGGGPVAASKLDALLAEGAEITVVAPEIVPEIAGRPVTLVRRAFEAHDLDGAWWVVAAAPPEVNRHVQAAAEVRHIFVNAVDDPQHATAYLGGVVHRHGVTVAVSTAGRAPALAGLLREALDAWLPADLDVWLTTADEARRRWKAERVPMHERRPQLLDDLNRLYRARAAAQRGPACAGSVALVGAGPGDPSLWTMRAVQCLERADLVLYDALVDAQALRRATPAQCFFVGKRAGRRSVRQETINRLMIRAARSGKYVVRLKGGDPFVFGRGGEEALELAMAGIPCEIVPGVSSAVAAPALAGIPVTHRGITPGFLVLSGHNMDAFDAGIQAVQPNAVSLIVMMGLGERAGLVAGLVRRGWSEGTPAAIVCAASTAEQWAWTGSLAQLAAAEPPEGLAGVLVIGDVVRVRDVLAAREQSRSHNEVSYGRNG